MRPTHQEHSLSPALSPHHSSTPNAYKLPPTSQDQTTHKVLQSIVKGRRSWKTLGGGELVWPPKLEAALLKGLERYQPDDSRETRLLGRFPMRNRFISDYIFSTTGKRRTAKQVGSRLQQLKVTDTGSKRLLMSLVSPLGPPGPAYRRRRLGRYTRGGYDSDSTSDTSSRPTTPTNIPNYDYELDTPSVIHIDLLPDAPTGPYSVSPDQPSPFDGSDIIEASQKPRRLDSIDPTITFVSRSPISAQSYFIVKLAGMSVFSETTLLTPAGPAPRDAGGALLFSTKLVPGWWDKILDSPDPTQYTILQEVIHDSPSSFLAFSAVYKFRYPSGSRHHHTHPPPMSRRLGGGVQIKYESKDSFDDLIATDGYFSDMGFKRIGPYDDHFTIAVEPGWGGHEYSPLQMPIVSNQSSIYTQSTPGGKLYNDFDSPPSLVSASFLTENTNYGIHSMNNLMHPHHQLHRCF
ncbi:hypothetical protein BDZ94DRAFT_782548 [Collybia nuda]|uniref:TEA domain-containing protein n=1 Tax=Collybia nuda TaxID=64659 RepID=A0A9P5YGR7_9AGAR|nr:hypothetical protein BDZ94DRAFT_782548 [Collybia nuda]